MDALLTQAGQLASQNLVLAYFIIYLAVIFFGNIAVFTALWLAFRGALGWLGVPAVIVVSFAATFTGDLVWFSLGWRLRETRFGNWIKRRMPGHEAFENHIEQRGPRYMFIAKFISGSNPPLNFSLGWTRRVEYRRYLRNSILALSLWLPVVVGASYGLYASLEPLAELQHAFHDGELLVAGVLIFVIVQYLLVAILKRLFGRNGK